MPTADREEALFAAALEKPSVERAAYLEGACGGDHALRQRIEALLAAHDAHGGVLDSPPSAPAPTTAYRPLTEGPGALIGPYKLLQQIGEGGMGVVYMAEQFEPVRRKVALKIIKPGMDSRQVIARFEAERQALAMMDHQNIARVLDAGTTESGRPYFVMELVHGVPITKFCDDAKMTPRERLALFVPVCQAIQHAHQKGIIHRDVKPSNVLVTMYDDKPVPKVIDFGVAKAIEQRLTEKTLFTQFGALVGTLEYMSPEQAEMNAFGVDTRSDVFSLGVLLYELLTGTTPLERKRLREAALDEMVRLIKEEEAPRPSARLSGSNDLPKIAAARKTEPARLSKLVRGEIDWMVMKCLEKDRSRRYDTASGLARDVERYLADEPVEACPPSAAYRLRKFARKHKKALVTVMVFAVLLVAGMVLSTLLAVWATSAQHEADRQRIASDEARQDADRQRIASDEAKREAAEGKVEADKQRDEARLAAYAAGIRLAQRYWEENNVGRARELLEELPKEAAGRELRGFEWYYLHRLCHSEALTLKGHDRIGAWSPDGRRLASRSSNFADHTVKIWDSVSGKELVSLTGHTGGVTSVVFSPDGQRLASGGADDLTSGSADHTVKIWDGVTGNELFSLGHSHSVRSVAFSPDGQRLASGGIDNTLKVWHCETGKELLSLTKLLSRTGYSNTVTSVAFSPDGRRLASVSDGSANIWDSETGKEMFSLQNHPKAFSAAAFSADGQRLAAGVDKKTVKIWDSVAGKEMFSLSHASVKNVAFSPDGERLASRSNDAVKAWDSATGKEVFSINVDPGNRGEFSGPLAFSPDGQRLASGSDNSVVKIWDSATGEELSSLKGHAGFVTSLGFSPDGQRLASAGGDNTVKIWDSDTAKELFIVKNLRISSVAFSPDSQRLTSGGIDNTVKIWDRATGKELFSLKGHTGMVSSVAFSSDGQRLASAGDKTAKIWDSVTGKELCSLSDRGLVLCVAFSPDGQRLASGGFSPFVKIWNGVTGEDLLSIKRHAGSGFVQSMAFSADGKRLASACNTLTKSTLTIWDRASGKELLSLKGHAGPVMSVAFSPDGQRLASGGEDTTVKIWDSASGKELLSLKGHAGAVSSVAFSPDSQRLASGGVDNTLKIWTCATGKDLLSLKGHDGQVTSVVFSPDGQSLASAEGDYVVLRETTVSLEMQQCRAAQAQVADLFEQVGLRAEVLERVRTAHGLSPAVRREALAAAQAYTENAFTLNAFAWERARLPGTDMAGYRNALRCSEEACRLEPQNGDFLNTLGVAYYRVGKYEQALATLLRSDQINKTQPQGSLPADLAFLAMTRRQLGHTEEAQAELRRLREWMKDRGLAGSSIARSLRLLRERMTGGLAQDAEAQGFLREAEALLAEPETPAGK